jgi:hypothetical protein
MARSPGLDAKDAISKACRDTGCDSSAQDTITFQFGAQETAFGAPCNPIISDCGQTDCTATLTVDGNFDNTNQRDYMQSILSKVLDEAQAQNADKTLSFAQVVLNDATGANQAQMSIKIDANCEKASSFDCDGLVATLIGGVLGEIPAVGGLVATAFDAGCQVASGKARRWVA